MILGKAPVLQKSHLPGAARPVFRDARPEFAATDVCRQQHPVWRGIERHGGGFRRNAGLLQGMTDALRPLPSIREHADQRFGITGVVEEAFFAEFEDGGRHDLGVVSLFDQGGSGLCRRILAARYQSQRRGARRLWIGGAAFIYPRGAATEAQFSFSFSESPPAFLAGSSLARTLASMSRAISG